LILLRVAVTLLIVPPIPATLMVDGYGVAAPWFGIVIADGLLNDLVPIVSVVVVRLDVVEYALVPPVFVAFTCQ